MLNPKEYNRQLNNISNCALNAIDELNNANKQAALRYLEAIEEQVKSLKSNIEQS